MITEKWRVTMMLPGEPIEIHEFDTEEEADEFTSQPIALEGPGPMRCATEKSMTITVRKHKMVFHKKDEAP